MVEYLLLITGFILLIAGADTLVRGASSIAKSLRISDLVIGLTVVALGTSAPELAVNITASSSSAPGMAIGNVIGSNIFNILVILGITAFLKPVNLKSSLLKIEIPYAILASIVLIVVAADSFIDGGLTSSIGRSEGIILLLFFAIFMYYITLSANKGEIEEDPGNTKIYPWYIAALMCASGLALLIWGGDMIVTHATTIARAWGISETIIGITIVATGTSLPELATSLAAARKGNSDMAIGNVVGSNIFNIFLILGVSSMISPLPFSSENITDALVAAGASVLLLLFGYKGRAKKQTDKGKRQIDKTEGAILFACYIGYIAFLIYR